jgi:antitoxin (DNA-binding transcriptional repressor) of toxin-antitoxin stability system
MLTMCIEEMQRDLRGHIQRVEAGETITVTDANTPSQRLNPPHRMQSNFAHSAFVQANLSCRTISMIRSRRKF